MSAEEKLKALKKRQFLCRKSRIKEESYLSMLREEIVKQYEEHPTGCGGSFGELLCWEIHENKMTFIMLAKKWGISLPTLGELIKDHCDRLQELPKVNFNKPLREITT